jgi:phage-related protein
MPSILNSFRDLAVSVVEVISSVCETTYNTLYELLRGFINFFIGISEMALHVVKGLSEVFGGVGRFINGEPLFLIVMNYCVNKLSQR